MLCIHHKKTWMQMIDLMVRFREKRDNLQGFDDFCMRAKARIWTSLSCGQILAVAFRYKPVKPFNLFPVR